MERRSETGYPVGAEIGNETPHIGRAIGSLIYLGICISLGHRPMRAQAGWKSFGRGLLLGCLLILGSAVDYAGKKDGLTFWFWGSNKGRIKDQLNLIYRSRSRFERICFNIEVIGIIKAVPFSLGHGEKRGQVQY